MVDTSDLKSDEQIVRAGSTPARSTALVVFCPVWAIHTKRKELWKYYSYLPWQLDILRRNMYIIWGIMDRMQGRTFIGGTPHSILRQDLRRLIYGKL